MDEGGVRDGEGWGGKAREGAVSTPVARRSGRTRSCGTGAPEAMYLKMSAWCSSSCHCDAVNRRLPPPCPLSIISGLEPALPPQGRDTEDDGADDEQLRFFFPLQGKWMEMKWRGLQY